MSEMDKFAKAMENANKAADDAIAKTQEQIDTHGMNAEQLEEYKNAQEIARLEEMGASAEQISHLKELQGELAETKRQKDILERTSNTMGVVSMGEAFDIARQADVRAEPKVAIEPIETEIASTWSPIPPPPEIDPLVTYIGAEWLDIPPPQLPEMPVMELPPVDPLEITVAKIPTPEPPQLPEMPVMKLPPPALPPEPIAQELFAGTSLGAENGTAEGKSEDLLVLQRIAAGIDALVQKEGLTVEEVSL